MFDGILDTPLQVVLRIAKFIGKHLQCRHRLVTLLWKWFHRSCFPINGLKFLRTFFYGLLLFNSFLSWLNIYLFWLDYPILGDTEGNVKSSQTHKMELFVEIVILFQSFQWQWIKSKLLKRQKSSFGILWKALKVFAKFIRRCLQ